MRGHRGMELKIILFNICLTKSDFYYRGGDKHNLKERHLNIMQVNIINLTIYFIIKKCNNKGKLLQTYLHNYFISFTVLSHYYRNIKIKSDRNS